DHPRDESLRDRSDASDAEAAGVAVVTQPHDVARERAHLVLRELLGTELRHDAGSGPERLADLGGGRHVQARRDLASADRSALSGGAVAGGAVALEQRLAEGERALRRRHRRDRRTAGLNRGEVRDDRLDLRRRELRLAADERGRRIREGHASGREHEVDRRRADWWSDERRSVAGNALSTRAVARRAVRGEA